MAGMNKVRNLANSFYFRKMLNNTKYSQLGALSNEQEKTSSSKIDISTKFINIFTTTSKIQMKIQYVIFLTFSLLTTEQSLSCKGNLTELNLQLFNKF